MSIYHGVAFNAGLLAKYSHSDGSCQVTGTGPPRSLRTYLFVGLADELFENSTQVGLATILKETVYLAPFLYLPKRTMPALACGARCGLRGNFAGCTPSYAIKNRSETAVLIDDDTILVTIRVAFTCDAMTRKCEWC